MKVHDFTLILTTDPSKQEVDALYGLLSDGTLSTVSGVPQIHFYRDARSLEEAIQSTIGNVRSVGFEVARVEMQPDTVSQPN